MSSFFKSLLGSMKLLSGPTLVQTLVPPPSPLPQPTGDISKPQFPSETPRLSPAPSVTLAEFILSATQQFGQNLDASTLLSISSRLQQQFYERLQTSPICMLPSYNHTLPTGSEQGTVLALDVGGSTLRVALVQLNGRGATTRPGDTALRIERTQSWRIDDRVKALRGTAFFDWMAARIEEMLAQGGNQTYDPANVLPMGLAWSFPIDQTSVRSGTLLEMGKGFFAAHGVVGHDLGDLIQSACSRRNLSVRMDAIVNDSTATLLSKAYTDVSTRFALILGTGVNMAADLPCTALHPTKYGVRPETWHAAATHVLVNTELSMFGGGGIIPTTKWDQQLDAAHLLPGFQPFEHLLSGRYLGEIVRLVIVEAVRVAGMFDGALPEGLELPYGLETQTLAVIQEDTTPDLSQTRAILSQRHPTLINPTHADLMALQALARAVATRAAAYLATGIHALWQLRNDTSSSQFEESERATLGNTTTIATNGSVIQSYPGFSSECQGWVDTLVTTSSASSSASEDAARPRVLLRPADGESSLFGAAVAVLVGGSELS